LFEPFPATLHLDPVIIEKANETLYKLYTQLGNIPCMACAVVYGGETLAEFNYGMWRHSGAG
jgi:hypothetical protein